MRKEGGGGGGGTMFNAQWRKGKLPGRPPLYETLVAIYVHTF